jgi:oxygen-dependent protoporphyrinogen oxidase
VTRGRPITHQCVIIGGGISGLAAALRVQDLQAARGGAATLLIEAAGRLGGSIATQRVGDLLIEAGPDSFLSRKPAALEWCDRLGVTADLIERRPELRGAFIQRGGQLHPLPEGMSGLVSLDPSALNDTGLLSEAGARRFAAEVNTTARADAQDDDEDESVGAFATRRFGAEACDYLIEPLLGGIYSGDIQQMSLQATFPQLRAAEREHGSVLLGLQQLAAARPPAGQYGPFLSLRHGMGQLIDAAGAALTDTELRIGTAVRSMQRAGDHWQLTLTAGERVLTRSVVVATPPHIAQSLLAEVAPTASEELGAIPAASTAIVSLALATDASRFGYGWLVPAREQRSAVAVSVSSNKWPGRAPADMALFRVFLGRWPDRDPTLLADRELIDLAVAELGHARIGGIGAEPRMAVVHRWRRAMPQYLLGHQQRQARYLAAIAALPGLAVAGAYLRGVGLPDCIASGQEAAASVFAYLEAGSG